MKKIFLVWLILIPFQFLIYSCENSFVTKPIQKDSVSEIDLIKQEYNSILKGSKPKINKFIDITPSWDISWKQKLNGQQCYIFPFESLKKEKVNIKLQDGSKMSIDDISFLIAKKEKEKYEFEIVTQIPDLGYLTNVSGKNLEFSGLSIVSDLLGNFKKGFKNTKNKEQQIWLNENSKARNIKLLVEVCTDWYTCVSIGGVDYGCTYNYTDCYVYEDGSSSAGDGSGYGSVGTGDGGGYGGDATGNAEGYDYSISSPFNLCPPTNWIQTGNAYTANIQNLGLTAIQFKYLVIRDYISVDIPSSCVSIPWYGINSYQAGERFAIAFNYARAEVEAGLKNGSIRANSFAIRRVLIDQIRNFLPAGSSYSSGPCGGSIPTNNANYGC